MKIPSSGHIHDKDPLKQTADSRAADNKGGVKATGTPGVTSSPHGDKIHISGRAKEIERISEMVRNTPDIRESKVAELKKAMDAGIYTVSNDKIAENILKEIRNDLEG